MSDQKPRKPFVDYYEINQPVVEDTSVFEEEEEDEGSTFSNIGQGIGAGVINIGQGLVELGAAASDAFVGTDYSRDVTDFFEDTKETLGFTPVGTAGKIAEGIVTFGSAAIPIVGWLGRANQVAQGAKIVPGASNFAKSAERFGASDIGKAMLGDRIKLAGTTSLATGAADVFIAPSTFNTVSDSFDALPDVLKTEEDTGLYGSEEGFRRLRNKLRFGAEGAIAGAAFETAFPVIGFGASGLSKLEYKGVGVPLAARYISDGFDKAGKKLSGGMLQKYFTAQGLAPREVYEGVQDVDSFIKAATRTAANRFKAFDAAAKKHVKESNLFGSGKEGINEAYEDTFRFLTGGFDKKGLAQYKKKYGPEVLKTAQNMRDQVNGLTDVFMKNVEDSALDPKQKKALVNQFSSNKNKYLRRMYQLHLEPEKFVVDMKKYDAAIKSVAGIIQKGSNKTSDEAFSEATTTVNRVLRDQAVDGGVNPNKVIDQLQKATLQNKNKIKIPKGPGGERALFNISSGMLKERSKLLSKSRPLRELLGEVTDPKELYLRTVGEMAQTLAANQFYRTIPLVSLEDASNAIARGGKPLAIRGEDLAGNPEAERLAAELGYRRLGEFPSKEQAKKMSLAEQAFGGKYGALTGHYVRNEVADSFTVMRQGQSFLNEALALSLQAKGLSQMTKTVLNPLSQIRNFHSGIFMVGANGNIGRDMGLFESGRLTVGKLVDMADDEFAETFEMLQKSGIVDQNYVVNEYRELLKEGADLKAVGKASEVTKKIYDKVPFVRPLVKGAQNVYSGTDNYWKTVGYLGEKAKFTNAIRRSELTVDDVAEELTRARLAPRSSELSGDMDFLDLMSTDIVKATMPTYSRVPEIIKGIRRIPVVGNFMAFPAEIVRTTTNITRQGLRELGYKASDDLIRKVGPKKAAEFEKQIQAIGSRRLTNYLALAYGSGLAAQMASQKILDFTDEQMKALERLAPYYMKGHTLMPIRNDKVNGKPVIEYIDLSYMMPYDFMIAPVRGALQAYREQGQLTDSDISKAGAAIEAAFSAFIEPFAGEALLAERIADVTVRGGRTKTGAEIFVEGEDKLDRRVKSLNHILGGFNPGVVELIVRERRGEFEKGRLAKTLTGDPGRYGEEYDAAAEAASMLTGFRELKTDLDKNFYYKGAEFTSIRSDLSGDFKSFAKRNDVTEDEIVAKYIQANENLKKAQASLLADVEAAEALGLSRSEVIRQLNDKAKIGKEEIQYLLSGKFRPITVNRGLVESILQESVLEGQPRLAEELPIQRLLEIDQQLRGTEIKPEIEEETIIESDRPAFIDYYEQSTPENKPAFIDYYDSSEIMPPVSTPSQTPQERQRMVIGTASNPFTAIRDLEISPPPQS